jgi:tetratricopeptide (TPR) repeat protein
MLFRFPRFSFITRSMALAAVIALAACAQPPKKQEALSIEQDQDDDEPEATTSAKRPTELPNLELTDQVLYEFLLAEIAGQRGNPNLAAQAYGDLARRTKDPRIARRATEVALYARMPAAALEAARVWAETEPDSPEAMRSLTSLLVAANRLEEAQPYLQKILASDSGVRGDGFLQLSRLLANNPDKAASLKLVQSLAQGHPRVPQARFAVAQAAANAGQDELAQTEIRESLKLKADWELAALFYAQLLQKDSNAAATAYLANYLKRFPKARDVRLAYARSLVGERKYNEARSQFQTLQQDFPDNTDVLFAVGVLSMQLEDWQGATAPLERLLTLGYRDRNTVRLYLGQIAEEQKLFPDALKWYGEVTRGEHFLPAQIRQAQVRSKQGDLAGARAFLQQVNATSNQQRVQLIRAETELLREANQPKEAFEVMERGLDKLPDHPDLLYDYSMLAEKLDRLDIMESSLRKVMRLKPDDANAYNALGYLFADRNERLPEARELIEKALKLAPEDAFIIDSMGWVLFRQGQKEESLKYLRRAYAARPDAEIAAHLGEVLWSAGLKQEAEQVWREALGKAPGNDTLIKTMQRLKQ